MLESEPGLDELGWPLGWWLPGSGRGWWRGQGWRDASSRCPFGSWGVPRAAAAGGCSVHVSLRNPSDHTFLGGSGSFFLQALEAAFPLKHGIFESRNHS